MNSRPPYGVPRAKSLLHRLLLAPPAGSPPRARLDELMAFLDDPPLRVADRWKEGALLCRGWGIPCTGASVWRLYRRHGAEWRARRDQQARLAGAAPEKLEESTEHLLALRAFELMATPRLDPDLFIALARLVLRKRALDFASLRHHERLQDKAHGDLKSFSAELDGHPAARDAFSQVLALLAGNQPPEPPA